MCEKRWTDKRTDMEPGGKERKDTCIVIGVFFSGGNCEPVLLLIALEIPTLISCSMYLLWCFPATATLHSQSGARYTFSIHYSLPLQTVDATVGFVSH